MLVQSSEMRSDFYIFFQNLPNLIKLFQRTLNIKQHVACVSDNLVMYVVCSMSMRVLLKIPGNTDEFNHGALGTW